MRKLVIATKNKNKIAEMKNILIDMPLEILSMDDMGIFIDIEETGNSFEENAKLKASEIYKLTGEMVLADDSGLEVDFLDGAPGIYSSRFAGSNATDEDRIIKLLNTLLGVPSEKRSARFVCATALILPDGETLIERGICEGYIAEQAKGENGFGYDPVFMLPQYGMTMAETDAGIKNRISHRAKALKLIRDRIKKTFNV